MLTDDSKLREILWNFSRYPSSSGKRLTLAENPHFYHHHHLHIKSPSEYKSEFTTDPVDHFRGVDDICVLTNKPSRVYLEFGKKSRAFDNIWKTNGVLIFKSQCLVFLFFSSLPPC